MRWRTTSHNRVRVVGLSRGPQVVSLAPLEWCHGGSQPAGHAHSTSSCVRAAVEADTSAWVLIVRICLSSTSPRYPQERHLCRNLNVRRSGLTLWCTLRCYRLCCVHSACITACTVVWAVLRAVWTLAMLRAQCCELSATVLAVSFLYRCAVCATLSVLTCSSCCTMLPSAELTLLRAKCRRYCAALTASRSQCCVCHPKATVSHTCLKPPNAPYLYMYTQ